MRTPSLPLCLFLLVAPSLVHAQSTPQELLTTFISASHAQDEGGIKRLWDSGDWSKDADNPGHSLFRQTLRKGFTFADQGLQTRQNRALATVDIMRAGKRVDSIYLYAVQKTKTWRFVHADENQRHAKYFLEGKVPGRFYIQELPTKAELIPVGEALIAIALGKATPEQRQLFTNRDDALQKHLKDLSGKASWRYTKSAWLASLKRGVLFIEHQETHSGDAGSTPASAMTVNLYIEAQGDKWRVYGVNARRPSTSLFLK